MAATATVATAMAATVATVVTPAMAATLLTRQLLALRPCRSQFRARRSAWASSPKH